MIFIKIMIIVTIMIMTMIFMVMIFIMVVVVMLMIIMTKVGKFCIFQPKKKKTVFFCAQSRSNMFYLSRTKMGLSQLS